MTLFRDRRDAGQALGQRLAQRYDGDVLVLGLPRGGVPVAFEVALALKAPLDVFVVRKLGVPGHEELAMGAIASGGVQVLVPDVVHAHAITGDEIETVAATEHQELQRRERLYRGDRPFPDLRGRSVIVVDDGVATGASMRAAIRALRTLGAARIVAAAPVMSREACFALRNDADACEAVALPEPFYGVGMHYRDFAQTEDDEVTALLAAARRRNGHAVPPLTGAMP